MPDPIVVGRLSVTDVADFGQEALALASSHAEKLFREPSDNWAERATQYGMIGYASCDRHSKKLVGWISGAASNKSFGDYPDSLDAFEAVLGTCFSGDTVRVPLAGRRHDYLFYFRGACPEDVMRIAEVAEVMTS